MGKLCECGCNQYLPESLFYFSGNKKYYRKYINGHYWKNKKRGTPSEEHKEKNRKAHIGKSSTFKGKKHTDEAKQKMREKHIGKITHSEEFKEDLRQRMIGNQYAKDMKPNRTSFKKGGIPHNKGKQYGEEVKLRMKKASLLKWENPDYIRTQIIARNRSKINKSEVIIKTLLDEIQPNEWKWVGNGEVIIEKRSPDFININGKKQIIEFFGNYWHKKTDEKDRINLYKRYGYKTLVIWESELRQKENVIKKMEDFIWDSTVLEP